jgi:hypothetical protein
MTATVEYSGSGPGTNSRVAEPPEETRHGRQGEMT